MSDGIFFPKIRFRFKRAEAAKFLSHLEQIREIKKSIEKSGLPVLFSEGRKGLMKIAFGPAISEGYQSECEFADVQMREFISAKKAAEILSPFMAAGLSVMSAERLPRVIASVEALAVAAEYLVEGAFGAHADIGKFLSREEIIVLKKKGDKNIGINAKELIREMEFASEGEIRMILSFAVGKNIKPSAVVSAFLAVDEAAVLERFKITRKNLFWKDARGALAPL